MTERDPAAIVIRSNPYGLLLILAACGFILIGVLAALWTSVVGGVGAGGLWTALGWVVLVPLALLLGLAVLMLGRQLIQPTTVVVSARGYRREGRGQLEVDLPLEDLTGVLFRPGGQATWQASDPNDPSVRGVGRSRLTNRIELRAPQATVEVFENHRWRETVDVVRGWVRARPELVDDETTRGFLATAGDQVEAAEPKPRWPLGMIRLAIRSRDPWAPFLPDAYGQYSAMFNGRYTAVRARERGGRVGLAARWLFVAMWLAPFLVLLYLVVRLALILV